MSDSIFGIHSDLGSQKEGHGPDGDDHGDNADAHEEEVSEQ